MNTPINFRLIIGVLVLASSVSIMSTDIYAPSLPHLPGFFGTHAAMVKLTISLNVLMFGLGQMFHGPLSDRFGRKPVLLGAIALFTVFSFACALAQSIEQLIIARMLQGFMGAAEAVVGMAIFRDLFDEKRQVRALAIFGMSIALGPALAPIIGGYVHVWLGWRANFHLIGAGGVLATVLIWKLLPESAAPDPGAIKFKRVIGNYAALITDKKFLTYAGLVSVGVGIIYAFVTGAPFILISQLGVPTENFGYFQALIVGAYFVGSLASMRLATRMQTGRLLGFGVALVLAGGGAFITLALLDAITPASFAASFSVMTFGLGPVFAVAPARAMLATTRSAGSAAAMLGACEMTVGGLAAGAVSLLHGDTVWPVGLPIAVLMLAAAVLAWRALRLSRPANQAAGN